MIRVLLPLLVAVGAGKPGQTQYCRKTSLVQKNTDLPADIEQLRAFASCCPIVESKSLWDKLRKYVLAADELQVMLDIGMYTGGLAKEFIQYWPKVKYFGFDLLEQNVEVAKSEVLSLAQAFRLSPGQFQFQNRGIGESSKTAQPVYHGIGDTTKEAHHSLLKQQPMKPETPSHRAKRFWQGSNKIVGEVDVITIDDFVKEAGLERIDFLNIDAEGSEPLILQGMKTTLSTVRPRVIFFECNRLWADNYEVPYTTKWAGQFLQSFGYDLFFVAKNLLIFADEPFYNPLFDITIPKRQCMAIPAELKGRDELLAKQNGRPGLANGLSTYLLEVGMCPGFKTPGKPQKEDPDPAANITYKNLETFFHLLSDQESLERIKTYMSEYMPGQDHPAYSVFQSLAADETEADDGDIMRGRVTVRTRPTGPSETRTHFDRDERGRHNRGLPFLENNGVERASRNLALTSDTYKNWWQNRMKPYAAHEFHARTLEEIADTNKREREKALLEEQAWDEALRAVSPADPEVEEWVKADEAEVRRVLERQRAEAAGHAHRKVMESQKPPTVAVKKGLNWSTTEFVGGNGRQRPGFMRSKRPTLQTKDRPGKKVYNIVNHTYDWVY